MRTLEEEEAAIRANPELMRQVIECMVCTPGNDAVDFMLKLHRVAIQPCRSRSELTLFAEAVAARIEEHIAAHAKYAFQLAKARELLDTPSASTALN